MKTNEQTVKMLIEQLERVIGDHNAPVDCYATGPLTGNTYVDFMSCPACEALSMIKELRSR